MSTVPDTSTEYGDSESDFGGAAAARTRPAAAAASTGLEGRVDALVHALERQMQLQRNERLDHRGHVKISKYTPGQDIRTWLKAFDLRCEAEGVLTEYERKIELMSNLDVHTAYAAVLRMRLPDDIRYQDMKQELIQRFSPRCNALDYRDEFRSRTQGKNESIDDFADALRQAAELAYPHLDPPHLEEELVDQFLKGVRVSTETRHRLYFNRPATLQMAKGVLRHDELAQKLARRGGDAPCRATQDESTKPKSESREDELQAFMLRQDDLIQKQQKVIEELLKQTAGPQNAQHRPKCHYCGKPGHVQAKCFKRQRDEEQGNAGARSPSGQAPRQSPMPKQK